MSDQTSFEPLVSERQKAPSDSSCSISFVSSAYNEEVNLELLYQRCLSAFELIASSLPKFAFQFSLVLVDNCSDDATPEVIRGLTKADARVKGFRNSRNYGPDPSFIQALKLADADVVVLLCSDLQDPPEFAAQMVQQLVANPDGHDAVFACKLKSTGSPVVRTFRKLYYRMLSFSDRDSQVFPGFHGFGCYSREVVNQALDLWRETSMNLRQCLSAATNHPKTVYYVQQNRIGGRSSYGFIGYAVEASSVIFVGKSLAGRLSLRLGFVLFMLSIFLGVFVLLNFASGHSGYARGVPTLALLILLSSSFQAIMLSLVSRQIESGMYKPARPDVRSRSL